MKNLLITILIGATILLFAAYKQKAQARPIIKIVPQKVPMSVRELQTFLNAQGHPRYHCKIDGKPGPETFKALDNWLCDDAYKRSPK